MKKVMSVFLALALILVLAACTPKNKEVVFNWNIGADPLTLDPTLNGASDGGDVINQTFEGLTREIDGIVYPGIAQSWTTSADGLTMTFNLRQSKWSDGSPLTAHDFVYSWKRGMDPATASEYSWIWEYSNIVGSLEAVYEDGSLDDVGIEAVDDYTFRVHFTVPTPYFESFVAFYHFMPVKQSSVEHAEGADGLWAKKPALAISNGPFKLTAYNVGSGLVLEKNDNYWNKNVVKITKINGSFIDIETTAYQAYNAGSLDFIPSVPASEVGGLKATKLDVEFFIFPLLGTYYYNFNMTLPQFQNQKLRMALALAINREAIVDALGAGQVPAVAFVPPGFRDHLDRDFFETAGSYGIVGDNSKYAQAVTLFAQAATELGKTEAELRLMLKDQEILYNTSGGHQLVAEMVQESWLQVLGIQVQIKNQEWGPFQESRKNGDYQIARGGWLTDFMDPAGMLAIFVTGNAYNDPKYNNANFNQLMTEAQATTNRQLHFEKLYAAQQQLMTDLPIIPVYHYTDTMLVKPYVQGWGRSVLGSVDFSRANIVNKPAA